MSVTSSFPCSQRIAPIKIHSLSEQHYPNSFSTSPLNPAAYYIDKNYKCQHHDKNQKYNRQKLTLSFKKKLSYVLIEKEESLRKVTSQCMINDKDAESDDGQNDSIKKNKQISSQFSKDEEETEYNSQSEDYHDDDSYDDDFEEDNEFLAWYDEEEFEASLIDIDENLEYAPFRNMNDDELLELLNLPDDETNDFVETSNIQFPKNLNSNDLSIIDDPDPEELMALEEELWLIGDDNKKTGVSSSLERALMEGVVPTGAGVGSGCLPGDYGFDPFNFATKDYFRTVQRCLLSLLPDNEDEKSGDGSKIPDENSNARPTALILRDYREAEIRHGRLAMLGAIIWPLQEILDRVFIPDQSSDFTVIYGGTTLPYLSLFMILILLLLGYLDIYAKVIKEVDTGEAFLPGECFWDPLKILDGAPDSMKRKMQERELNNGRFAMIAIAMYVLEEAIFHKSLISISFNQILFEPAFEIPAVQEWLDRQFQGPSTIYPNVRSVDFVDAVQTVLENQDIE